MEYQSRPKEATAILKQLAQHPGYRYLPINTDWQALCSPFFTQLYGTKQVTDAYLFGFALREDLVLVTIDKAIFYLASTEHSKHVLGLKNE